MIAYVKGKVAYLDVEAGLVVLETGGIGYNIFVPGK